MYRLFNKILVLISYICHPYNIGHLGSDTVIKKCKWIVHEVARGLVKGGSIFNYDPWKVIILFYLARRVSTSPIKIIQLKKNPKEITGSRAVECSFLRENANSEQLSGRQRKTGPG